MKKLIPIFLLSPLLMGMFTYSPMPQKPDFTQAADFVQERYDSGRAFPKTLAKEQLVVALVQGKFDNSKPSTAYSVEEYPYDPNFPPYNGVITLKDGTLYTWSIPRDGMIEIQDSQHRMGCIFYPKKLLKLSQH